MSVLSSNLCIDEAASDEGTELTGVATRPTTVALLLACVFVAACGRTVEPAAGGTASEAPEPSITTPSTDDSLLPMVDEPPIWPLTVELTDQIAGGVASRYFPAFAKDYAPVAERCAAIRRGPVVGELIAGNTAIENCLRPYLVELGVGEKALDLFFATGVAIWGATPSGPVWLLESFDYDMFGSNGSPPEHLFTADGLFDIPGQFTSFSPLEGWAPLLDALEVANSADPMPEVRAVYAREWKSKPNSIGFWTYGEKINLQPARERSGGWVIPFSWIVLGCHACDTPIVGQFELGVDAVGSVVDARFVGFCYDTLFPPNVDGEYPGGPEHFGLDACTTSSES